MTIDLSGDILVVGDPDWEGFIGIDYLKAGAVYIFHRNEGGTDNWGLVKTLHASDAEDYDGFGTSIAIDGGRIVATSRGEDGGSGDPYVDSGAAYVFEHHHGGIDNWGEVAILYPSNPEWNYQFGSFEATISGDTVLVGAQTTDYTGAVHVFDRNHGGEDNWGEVKILSDPNGEPADMFGKSIAIHGETVVIGSPGEDGGAGNPYERAGAAFVYIQDWGGADNWGEVQLLHTSEIHAHSVFGAAVGIDGDTILVGAMLEYLGDDQVGAVYVLHRNLDGADQWGQAQVFYASDPEIADGFGEVLDIDGETSVIGNQYKSDGVGAAYIFNLKTLYQIPTANPVSPDSAEAGGSGFNLAITGGGFTEATDFLWDGIALTTTYHCPTCLIATIPESVVADEGIYPLTLTNPSPGGGISEAQYFFVTESGTPVNDWDSDTSTDPGGTAEASTGGSGPSTPGSLTATASGSGTVVVAIYQFNPGGEITFGSTGTFMDVHIEGGSAFTSVDIEYCDLGGGTEVNWWNGTSWQLASDQNYDPDSQCVAIHVDDTTSPSLADLTGTYFGSAGGTIYFPLIMR
jgi:hypothetical protein